MVTIDSHYHYLQIVTVANLDSVDRMMAKEAHGLLKEENACLMRSNS